MTKNKARVKIQGTILLQPTPASIERAAQFIRHGGLVAFPTETVYGLGADATNAGAVSRIFYAKGRPADNPLIVHISDPAQLEEVASKVPDRAYKLMEQFWPGPLSLVLPRSANIPETVSAGLDTVAVRMPSHRAALSFLEACAVPVAAPSANYSGRPSPTRAVHVLEDLAGRIEAVLDGGPCAVGVESTVLDLTRGKPVILRPGGITLEELTRSLGEKVNMAAMAIKEAPPLSPGMKYRHYRPRAALILITGETGRSIELIKKLDVYYRASGKVVCLFQEFFSSHAAYGKDLPFLARSLFNKLRYCDSLGADVILVRAIAPRGLGVAVMNRLHKAAFRILRV